MCKCDFCQHSRLVDGKLECPFIGCILTQSALDKILDKVSVKNEAVK